MCLATAYVVGGGGEPILEEVSYMQLDGDQVEMVSFSGEKKVIQGRLIEVDFFAETLLLEQYDTSTAEVSPGNAE
ncbi:MAG: CooT family nickel-binding protein [Dehalococcoidia bacterium]